MVGYLTLEIIDGKMIQRVVDHRERVMEEEFLKSEIPQEYARRDLSMLASSSFASHDKMACPSRALKF